MVKKTFLVALSILILIGVCSCMIMKKTYTPDEKKEIVLKYLKDKYNEEFVAESLVGSDWAYSYDKLYLHPKNGKKGEDTFVVRFSGNDDGTYGLSDGYFGIIIKDQYEAVMSGFMKDIYTDFLLYTDFGQGIVFPDRLNKDTEISEIYNKEEHFSPDTTVFVKQSSGADVSESLRKIAQRMIENKLVGEVKIYEVFDDKYEVLSKIKASEILDKLEIEKTKEYFVHELGRYIWVDDNLKMSEVE